MRVSIVIRTLNERAYLDRLLRVLREQDHNHDTEVIVVDNQSTDGTAETASRQGATVVPIRHFTYPRSMNLGCEASTGDVVVQMVGHAIPFSRTWLADGVRHFHDPSTAGVFAWTWYDPTRATAAERVVHSLGYAWARMRGVYSVKKVSLGVLGATNCIIRRSLWQTAPFDEAHQRGGEDMLWAQWALDNGHAIIRDPAFSLYHSHGLGWRDLSRQWRFWLSYANGQPQVFNKGELLEFRRDLEGRL